MKGKTFSVYKVIFVVTALMAMIIGAGISFMPTKTKSYAAEAVVNKTEDYSQVDANGNILSVEKVYVVSGNNVNDQSGSYASSSIVQNFLSEQTGAGWNSMKTSQNKTGSTEKESYYYKNLQQDSKYFSRNH